MLSLSWSGDNADRFVFQDALVYESPGDGLLTIPKDIAYDDRGFLHMVGAGGSLIVWNRKGKITHLLGGIGEGPGRKRPPTPNL